MRTIPAYLRRGVIVVGLMIALPGFATTYYCDNDRSSSQYHYCSTFYGSGSGSTWIYYSGQGGDYNGDDRRYRSTIGSSGGTLGGYQYTFPSGHAYTYFAYINNAAFTSDNAIYIGMSAHASTISFANSLNQNTAPGGWHVVGKGTTATPIVEVYSGQSGQITGADGMRATFSTAANSVAQASKPAADASSNPDDMVVTDASCGALPMRGALDVAAIQQKMLNATDNYKDVSGQYRIFFRNNGQSDTVDFKSSEAQHRSWARSTDAMGHVVEQAVDASAMTIRYPAARTYSTLAMAPVTKAAIPSEQSSLPRFYHDGNCKAVYVHAQGSVHVTAASDTIAPENIAFWLSTANSRVMDHGLMLGRSVTVIEGAPDRFLQEKLLATRFTMWVDDKTGVLMRLLGTDAAGNVAYSIDMINIEFDKNLNLDPVFTRAPTGWSAISNATL